LANENEVGTSLEMGKTGSLEMIPENCPLDPNGRLSISLDDQVKNNLPVNAIGIIWNQCNLFCTHL
jgi:hypothetical protein